MNKNFKKVLSVAICFITIFAWIVSVFGLGSFTGLSDKLSLGLDMIGGVSVVLEAETNATGSELKSIMEQVQAVMEKRVNEMGLSEPVISVENENRIRIELAGAKDAQAAIETIGKTAVLRFVTTDGEVVITGENVKSAKAENYQGSSVGLLGTYSINLEFDGAGSSAFEKATQRIVNGQVVPKEPFASKYKANQILVMLDDDVISDPQVSEVISSTKCQITGNFDSESASNLAALIRGGSLPVSLKEIQTEIVGPSLGIDAAKTSAIAGAIGVALIFIIMVAYYKVMGVVADIALAIYILLVMWFYGIFHAVLTLPGIAGLILSVGMAVDSNVVIFERIKEEIGLGKSVRVAVQSGFARALTSITDSQITTAIAAVILYLFGTGSVRGFAITLLIGIILSIFTAVVISQFLLKVLAETKLASPKNFSVKKVSVLGKDEEYVAKYNILGKRKIFYIASVCVIVLGISIGLIRGYNTGIDFTGGTIIQLNNGKYVDDADIKAVLEKHDIKAEVRYAGTNNEKVVIKTKSVIDNDDRDAICNEIKSKCNITTSSSEYIEQAGLIGPSVGSELTKNAIKSCIIAALAMLAYIAFRFEWKYGVAAVLALCHDALMLFAVYGLFHFQMNSPFIAGLLVVIGYSINDTIVVFDRVRENVNLNKKTKLETLANKAVNQSITRALMTSITTFIAILPLTIMCGDTIQEFVIPLITGCVCGTFSSLFLASEIYFDLTKLFKHNKYKG